MVFLGLNGNSTGKAEALTLGSLGMSTIQLGLPGGIALAAALIQGCCNEISPLSRHRGAQDVATTSGAGSHAAAAFIKMKLTFCHV